MWDWITGRRPQPRNHTVRPHEPVIHEMRNARQIIRARSEQSARIVDNAIAASEARLADRSAFILAALQGEDPHGEDAP